MHVGVLIDLLKQQKTSNEVVKKHTMLVNEKMQEEGILFFIPIEKKEFKILVPAPFHQELLPSLDTITYIQLLQFKHAVVLK